MNKKYAAEAQVIHDLFYILAKLNLQLLGNWSTIKYAARRKYRKRQEA